AAGHPPHGTAPPQAAPAARPPTDRPARERRGAPVSARDATTGRGGLPARSRARSAAGKGVVRRVHCVPSVREVRAMLGKRATDGEGLATDHPYLDHVGRDSFYGFLATQREQLFRDEDFAALYCPDNGRPSVP